MAKSKKYIPYGRQNISRTDINNVIKVLKSDFLTQGPQVPLFENEISDYVGSKFCTLANSATSALHLACMALEVSKNDYVWTSAISFVATSNAALYCGAKIKFIDINESTFNISANLLEDELVAAKKQNALPKAVIVVHMCGQSANMKKIFKLSKKYKFHIIEDASHAIGGSYQNKKIGSCLYSDLCIFSFHPVKIITTGEGGAVTTNDINLHKKIKNLATHGITKITEDFQNKSDGSWYYEQQLLGCNYRMTDIQASLGRSQLKRIDNFVIKRNKIAYNYNQLLKHLPINLPIVNSDCFSSFHLYVIRVKEEIKHLRDKLFNDLKENGVGVNIHYIPIYKHPFYKRILNKKVFLPNAEKYYKTAISIPIFPGLEKSDQKLISKWIEDSISRNLE